MKKIPGTDCSDWVARLDNGQMLALLMAVSLLIKISIWILSPVITPDGPVYIAQAEEFLSGNWNKALSLRGDFIYPLMIAALGYVGIDLVVAGRLLSLVFSVTTLIPLFLLTCKLFDRRVALWTGLVFAVSPGFNEFSVYVMRDSGFLCIFGWAVYFAVRAVSDNDFGAFVHAQIFSLLSFMFRMEGVFLPVLLLLFILADVIFRQDWKSLFFKKVIGLISVLLLLTGGVFFCLDSDFSRFNRLGNVVRLIKKPLDHGVFSYDPQIKIHLKKMEEVIRRGVVDNDFAEIAREHVRLIYFIGLLANVKKVVYSSFFLAGIAGLAWFRRPQRMHWLSLGLGCAYLLVCYLYLLHRSFIETRYVYVPAFLFLPWVGYGINQVFTFLKKLRYLPKLVPPLLLLVLFVVPAVEAGTDVKRQLVSAKLAGIWLAAHPELNKGKMLANNREIPFYSRRGMDFVSTKEYSLEKLTARALKRKVQLIGVVRELGAEPAEIQFSGFVQLNKFTDARYESYIFRKQDETTGN